MALDDALMKQLMVVFEVELAEQIQLMTTEILALEKASNDDAKKHLDDILRAAHTIKGAAKGVEQNDIVEVIHRFESIVSALAKGVIQHSSAVLDLLLEALDRIQDIFDSQLNNQKYLFDFNQLLINLDTCFNNIKAEAIKLDVESIEKIDSQPNTDLIPPPNVRNSREHRVSSDRDTYSVTVQDVTDLSVIVEDLQTTKLQFKQMLNDYRQLAITLTNLSSSFNELSVYQTPAENNKVHDLVVELSHFSNRVTNSYNKGRALGSQFNQLAHILDGSVNTLRLVPFATLIAPLHRIVRDLSQQQNKQINFIVEGSEIKIDRHLYKNIHVPLVHLINNAIDHGIESIDVRREKGKNIAAVLKLSIIKRANELLIDVSDDGLGIDLEAIKQKAIKQGLITRDEANDLDEKQISDFIFKPGFSSKNIVTTISGRGVGLDIVRNNLRKIKGFVEVSSTLNEGTKFTLKLPATLSSEQGLLISVAAQTFAIPAYGIDWIRDSHIKELGNLNGKLLLLDKHEEPVSVFYLADLLGISSKNNARSDTLPTIYISDGKQNIVLIVDEIMGDQELIIKAFSYPLIKVPFSLGMTTLASGNLIPILSVDELIEKANSLKTSTNLSLANTTDEQQKKVLIVDDSVTTRTLASNILLKQGFQVTALVNGLQAWEELTRNNNYDLIITDIEMPLINGFELVEKVKGNEKMCTIPTIIVTSLNSEQDKKRGVQVGADAYISKDQLNSDTLLTIIKQLI
ncbi:MAG: response regulator [Methylococcales bacterium]|nr:response regulator [Methylococcales bacterium]